MKFSQIDLSNTEHLAREIYKMADTPVLLEELNNSSYLLDATHECDMDCFVVRCVLTPQIVWRELLKESGIRFDHRARNLIGTALRQLCDIGPSWHCLGRKQLPFLPEKRATIYARSERGSPVKLYEIDVDYSLSRMLE